MLSFAKSIVWVMIAAASAQQPPATTPNPTSAVEDTGEFMVVPLKHRTAYDLGFTLEDLLKPRNGHGPSFDEGPDEKTLIVRYFKPAQKENILKMIAMFDIEQPEDAGKRRGRNDDVPNPRAMNVKIFPLQYTTPGTMLETLIPLFKTASLVGDPGTNSIIVSATNADIAIIERLLTRLDKTSDSSRTTAPAVRTVQLKHRGTDDVSKKLMSLLGSMRDRDARIASDEGRGKLILRGSNEFLDFAGKVISELDVPAQMIQFEFAFFSTDQNAQVTDDPDDTNRIPNDLVAVGKELQRFGRVKLLGRLACNAMEDHQFQVDGALGEGLSAKVMGSIVNAVTDGSLQLNVQGQVRLTRFAGDPRAAPQTSSFEINTTVVTRRGDTVMIGSAPAGWAQGESVIMVLQAKK